MVEHFLSLVNLFLTHNPLVAPIVFVSIHTLMAVLFIPCSPMTLMAGALWGQSYGLFISMIAAIVSSSTTFVLSRSLLQRTIRSFLMCRYPKTAGVLEQVTVHDWKIIAVAQMNPMIPASTMGYIFGLSRISFARYVLLSGLFFLPLQVLFVITGHLGISLIDTQKNLGYAITCIVLVSLFVLMSKPIYKKLCRLLGIKDGT